MEWGEVGKGFLGVAHLVGGGVLDMYGLGGLADGLEKVEADSGYLPEWAQTRTRKDDRFGTKKAPKQAPSKAPTQAQQEAVAKIVAAVEVLRKAGYEDDEIKRILRGPGWGGDTVPSPPERADTTSAEYEPEPREPKPRRTLAVGRRIAGDPDA